MTKVIVEKVRREDNVICFRLGVNEKINNDKAVARYYNMFKNSYERIILKNCKGYKWSNGNLYFNTFEKANNARQIIESKLVVEKLLKSK